MSSISSDELVEPQSDMEKIQKLAQELQSEYEKGHNEHIQAMGNIERQISLMQVEQHQIKMTQGVFQETQSILENQAVRLEHELNTAKIDSSTSDYDQRQTIRSQNDKIRSMERSIQEMEDVNRQIQKSMENVTGFMNDITKDREDAISIIGAINRKITQIEERIHKGEEKADRAESKFKTMARQVKYGMNSLKSIQGTLHEQQYRHQHQYRTQTPRDHSAPQQQLQQEHHQHQQHEQAEQHQYQHQQQYEQHERQASAAMEADEMTVSAERPPGISAWRAHSTALGTTAMGPTPGQPTPRPPQPQQQPHWQQQQQQQQQHRHQHQHQHMHQTQYQHQLQHQHQHQYRQRQQQYSINFYHGVTWTRNTHNTYDFGLSPINGCNDVGGARCKNNAYNNQYGNKWDVGENARNLVDRKKAVKPDVFGGKDVEFVDWTEKMIRMIGAMIPDARRMMEWAETQDAPIDNTRVKQWGIENAVYDALHLNEQIWHSIMQYTDGRAKTTVKRCELRGIEAWRQLQEHHPKNGNNTRHSQSKVQGER